MSEEKRCIPICDACVHYRDFRTNGEFTGMGKCVLTDEEVLCSWDCENFYCSVCNRED